MSWDLYIYNWPKDIKSVQDVPEDWKPPPIAPRSEIVSKIKAALPHADFSDPRTVRIEGSTYSVDVGLGTNQTCYAISLIARGDQSCVDVISAIVTNLNVRAFDTGSGDWFKPGAGAAAGFRQWSEWKEGVSAKISQQNLPKAFLSPADWTLVFIALAAFVAFFANRRRRSR